MLIKPLTIYRKRPPKPRASETSPTPPVVPLELVSATYVPDESVTLTFNQPIDVSGILPDAVTVIDAAITGHLYTGSYYNLDTPTTLTIGLIQIEATEGLGTRLYVDASNGVMSATGEAWSGVSDLVLPFG